VSARRRGGAVGRYPAAALPILLAALSCSHPQPAPSPVPEIALAPTPAPLAPVRAAGLYDLQVQIQGRTQPAPPATPARRTARGRAATPAGPILQLLATAAAALEPTAPSTTQFTAAVALPGYTMPPRGRTTQAASWWPTGGDSVMVYWLTPRSAAVSLRGALRGDTLSGDIWYTSESGTEFQLGRFTAVRRRAAGR
jgi:hypothetical protein